MTGPSRKPPAIEYVVVINGLVTVAYRHRSDARLRALDALPGSHVVIAKREVGTGRWIDTHENPACKAGDERA